MRARLFLAAALTVTIVGYGGIFAAPPLGDTGAATPPERAPGRTPPAASASSSDGSFHYQSLKGAAAAEIFQFMADGKSEFDRESEVKIRNRVPANFWTADARASALALLEANRTDAHRAAYRMSIEDAGQEQPPAQYTIAFSDSSARDYNAVDAHYFLRVDPQDSYLAYARSWAGGEVFYNAVHDQPAFDLRWCPLRYEEARHLAAVIWWINRARSRDAGLIGGLSSSTADGHGELVVRAGGRSLIECADTLWAGYLSERWQRGWNDEALLNFAAYLMTEALPEHLGEAWSKWEPKYSQQILARQKSSPGYTAEERRHLEELSRRFLDWCTPGQERISFPIVGEAARLAAAFDIGSAAERLRAIQAELPVPGPPRRTAREVLAEQAKLPYFSKDPAKSKELESKRAALEQEFEDVLHDARGGTADSLRRTTGLALRQLAAANDAGQLHDWAISKEAGCQWAFQRLAQIDPQRYADTLEELMRETDAKWSRQFFDELVKTDPARAAKIARDLPPEKKDALAVSAFALLSDAEKVPDEAKRIATIVQILLDPKNGWEERGRAIDLLVPPGKPQRYPGHEVDDALLKLFEPGEADDVVNFSLEHAARALALRGRTDLFDRFLEQLKGKAIDPTIYDGLLSATTLLAQADPPRFNPRLLALLKPNLARTNKNMTEIFWAIWSADLRKLQPDLERLATHSVAEYEDGKAHSEGGDASPVKGRFHFARKIVGLWSEPDAAVRVRMLIAFAAMESFELVEEPQPERLARLKMEMHRAGSALSAADKTEVAAFLDAMQAAPPVVDGKNLDPEECRKVIALARREMEEEPGTK